MNSHAGVNDGREVHQSISCFNNNHCSNDSHLDEKPHLNNSYLPRLPLPASSDSITYLAMHTTTSASCLLALVAITQFT